MPLPFPLSISADYPSQLGTFLDRLAYQGHRVRHMSRSIPSRASLLTESPFPPSPPSYYLTSNSVNRHGALKVVKSAGRYAETARDEIKLLRKVMSANLQHPGRDFVVSFLDSFTHAGPDETHICMVFEPLGENLLTLIERNKAKGVPRSLVKVIARQILLGLQYLHDECDLVHTDIKPENISMCHI